MEKKIETKEDLEKQLLSYENMWDKLKDYLVDRINHILHGFGGQDQIFTYCDIWKKMNEYVNNHTEIIGKLVERKMKKITCPTCGEINLKIKEDKDGTN
jgi:hypothetical protein